MHGVFWHKRDSQALPGQPQRAQPEGQTAKEVPFKAAPRGQMAMGPIPRTPQPKWGPLAPGNPNVPVAFGGRIFGMPPKPPPPVLPPQHPKAASGL